MLGGRLVFTFPSISAVYMSDPDIRESLTTIEAINAVGDRAPSFMILPGQVFLEKYFDNDIPNDVAFTTNEETGSGFSNDMIALDWFEHWEEATRPGIKMRRGIIHSGEYRILVMDGHGSHLTKEFINNCWDYKVVPFLLPAHSTHILQPLDIGIFHLMKAQHQNILAEQVRFGGCEYSRTDFLDAYNEICVRSMKKNSIIHAWESSGLVPFQPHIVLNNMRKFQPQEPSRTPEPEESFAFEWASCETPQLKLPEIQRYSAYIDSRLTGAIDGSIPLSPTVARVVEKRNKAQSIVALNGILALEELDKRRAEEARRARHKRDGGQRRIASEYGVIKAGDARLRIAGREQYIEQKRAERAQKITERINKVGTQKWGVISRAAARRGRDWQPRDPLVLKRYNHWMAEMLNFHRTGCCTLVFLN